MSHAAARWDAVPSSSQRWEQDTRLCVLKVAHTLSEQPPARSLWDCLDASAAGVSSQDENVTSKCRMLFHCRWKYKRPKRKTVIRQDGCNKSKWAETNSFLAYSIFFLKALRDQN